MKASTERVRVVLFEPCHVERRFDDQAGNSGRHRRRRSRPAPGAAPVPRVRRLRAAGPGAGRRATRLREMLRAKRGAPVRIPSSSPRPEPTAPDSARIECGHGEGRPPSHAHAAPDLFSRPFFRHFLLLRISPNGVAPGQFAMIDVPGRVRPYLRRAYSVADADPEEGSVEFLVKTIGPGTAALEEMPEDSAVRLARAARQRIRPRGPVRRRPGRHRGRRHRGGALSGAACARWAAPASRATSSSADAAPRSSRSGSASRGSCRARRCSPRTTGRSARRAS